MSIRSKCFRGDEKSGCCKAKKAHTPSQNPTTQPPETCTEKPQGKRERLSFIFVGFCHPPSPTHPAYPPLPPAFWIFNSVTLNAVAFTTVLVEERCVLFGAMNIMGIESLFLKGYSSRASCNTFLWPCI